MLKIGKNKSLNRLTLKNFNLKLNYLSNKIELSTSQVAENNEIDVRINEVGVQMINEKLRRYLFGGEKNKPAIELVEKSRKHLNSFDLNKNPLDSFIKDVDNIELPKMRGRNIEEHFETIGNEQTREYRKLISLFSAQDTLPKMPKSFSFKSGWTKYEMVGNKEVLTQVDYPREDTLVFDVETLVLHENCPVIAVAASSTAWYTWCSQRLIEKNFMYMSNLQLNDLIPLESNDFSLRKSQKRIVIGHNVGFDRSFIREQYFLEKSGMRFLDTMSMHIACCGFTSEQRTIILNKENPFQDIDTSINNKKFQRTKNQIKNYNWRDVGSLNNLKDVHAKHCFDSKTTLNKETRSVFIKGSPDDVINDFQNLMLYCAIDVLATYEVFQRLTIEFFKRFPHPLTFAGMLTMSTMYLPVNQNWNKYLENCQNAFDDSQNLLKNLLEKSAKEACKFKDEYENDPWLSNLDWTTKEFNLNKTNSKSKKSDNEILKSTLLNEENVEKNPLYKVSNKETRETVDNFVNNLEFNEITKQSYLTCTSLPKNIQSLYGYPEWYRELCLSKTDKNWQPTPSQITTKTRVTPSLLRLTWNGFPLHHHQKFGWGYLVTINEMVEMRKKEQNENKKYSKKAPKDLQEIIVNKNKIFQKIPHKDGNDLNVGNPLSKSFITKIEEGMISSIPKKSASLALKFYSNISYWENNEKRIRSQKVIWLNENQEVDLVGAILPIIAVSGTITRRAVEPTWLTASNYKKERIGSELKTMVNVPSGYNLIGADVDSQELWIASTIGDAHFAKIHGSTALGWMNLQGKKSDGTDMHSKTAAMIGISRDQAKVFNYGRIYGAGRSFAEKLLMQFDPTLSEKDARLKAKNMYEQTKGKRVKQKVEHIVEKNELWSDENENDLTKQWTEGTESEMFNKLEEIARSSLPKTPALGALITRTLEPVNVSDEFMTSRINWVVQSSAVDYLHIMLACMNWLIEEYQIDARFSISIHDEIRYIVKEEDSFRAALALQITNLLTRAYFSKKLGFDDLPMSVAFFSAIDIDKCLRKEPDLEFVSPSNPNGLTKGYQIPKGVCMDIYKIIEKTNGRLTKE